MIDYSTYLLYGFNFNRCIEQEQISYSAATINKVKVAVTKKKTVTATISFVRFYEWSHVVSINQRVPLLSKCRTLNIPISPRKGNPRLHEASNSHILLTHWGRDKMVAFFQTTFLNAFSWMKLCVRILIKISLKLIPKGPINNIQHWLR